MMNSIIPFTEVLGRLALAALLGGLIGIERERKDWAAGMRTHMMVCIGSTLIMLVSAFGFSEILTQDHIGLDPSRIAAQVVTGVGFMGAGSILFLRQEVVRGLTTAAALWTVAGIGLAIGGGMYFAAVSTTFLVLFILALLKPIENMFFKRSRVQVVKIVGNNSNVDLLSEVYNVLTVNGIVAINLSSAKKRSRIYIDAKISNVDADSKNITTAISSLNAIEDVEEVFWDNNR